MSKKSIIGREVIVDRVKPFRGMVLDYETRMDLYVIVNLEEGSMFYAFRDDLVIIR